MELRTSVSFSLQASSVKREHANTSSIAASSSLLTKQAQRPQCRVDLVRQRSFNHLPPWGTTAVLDVQPATTATQRARALARFSLRESPYRSRRGATSSQPPPSPSPSRPPLLQQSNMTSPRPSSEPRRKESTYERERQRDGGRGDRRTGSSGGASGAVRTTQEEDDRIGPYLIGEEIGRGSFATVFRGRRFVRCLLLEGGLLLFRGDWQLTQFTRMQDTNAPVAIKAVIRSKLTTKLLENLESEISILKRITHRNIVELKDCLVRLPFPLRPPHY